MTDRVVVQKVDEVHVRVKADPGVVQELSDHFTFYVPGYQFTPSYRNKWWDGKIRLLNVMSGLIYAGLLKYIEKFCRDRDYEFSVEGDLGGDVVTVEAMREHVDKVLDGTRFKDREHQFDAILHCARERRALCVSPTASGKSMIIYILSRWFDDLRGKTLILVPTTSLVEQMYSDFEDYGYDCESNVHRIFSGKDKFTDKKVVISTWQSVYKLPKEWFDQFSVIMGDEAHGFQAKSLCSLMEKATNCKYRFGFTGTLDGTQTHKLVLEGLFGPVLKVISTKELMDRGHVSKLKIKIIVLQYTESTRKKMAKATFQEEMDFIARCRERNIFIANLANATKGNTLALFQYVEKHGKPLFETMKEKCEGRTVHYVSGSVNVEERENIRKMIDSGDGDIGVTSYGTFSTGVNIERLHNVIFASPSKSRIRNLQSIGRGLRKAENKEHGTLYDVADDLSWKSRVNYTLKHLAERIKIYNEEGFDYKIYRVNIDA